jgi:uncharacterized membrane protein
MDVFLGFVFIISLLATIFLLGFLINALFKKDFRSFDSEMRTWLIIFIVFAIASFYGLSKVITTKLETTTKQYESNVVFVGKVEVKFDKVVTVKEITVENPYTTTGRKMTIEILTDDKKEQ